MFKRTKEIERFRSFFGSYLHDRPFIFQKFSFHGLILAREILSKAREEVNKLCMEDLAEEINKRQEKIDEMKKTMTEPIV